MEKMKIDEAKAIEVRRGSGTMLPFWNPPPGTHALIVFLGELRNIETQYHSAEKGGLNVVDVQVEGKSVTLTLGKKVLQSEMMKFNERNAPLKGKKAVLIVASKKEKEERYYRCYVDTPENAKMQGVVA